MEDDLTSGDVADIFRVDTKTVTRWVKRGWLTAYRRTRGGHARFRKEDVAKMISAVCPRCHTNHPAGSGCAA